MAQSVTRTYSSSNTFTEARVRYVMDKVFDDFIPLVVHGFASRELVQEWVNEITVVLILEAVEFFEIQFKVGGQTYRSLRFEVSDDGTIAEDRDSGGIDYEAFPQGTRAVPLINCRVGAKNEAAARSYLRERGWGSGNAFNGPKVTDRGYSSGGYGLSRSKMGAWP